ncbi:MAG: CRISPR-associated protein Csx3 [Gammaproteobacteria bacterium]
MNLPDLIVGSPDVIIEIDLQQFFEKEAKLADLQAYIDKALQLAGSGNEVILTGGAPIWLYLKIAHALHGKAKRLIYRSPVTGDVVIFDHDPF